MCEDVGKSVAIPAGHSPQSFDGLSQAERTLNAALTASKEAMAKEMQDSAQVTAKVMRREV